MNLVDVIVTGWELQLVLQAALLGYLISLPSKDKIKHKLVMIVSSYVVYSFIMIPYIRSSRADGDMGGFGFADPLWNLMVPVSIVIFLAFCLDLFYALLKRRRDWKLWIIYAVIGVSVLLWCLQPGRFMGEFFGDSSFFKLVYFPLYLYGMGLLFFEARKVQSRSEKRRLWIVFYAFFVPIVMVLMNVVLLNIEIITPLIGFVINLIVGFVRILAMFVIVQSHELYRINLESASQGIFENIEEPVILVSPSGNITRTNPIAQTVFGLEASYESDDTQSVQQFLPEIAEGETRFEAH